MDIVFKELFATDIGLLSLFTIGFMVVMAIWLFWWFNRKIKRDE